MIPVSKPPTHENVVGRVARRGAVRLRIKSMSKTKSMTGSSKGSKTVQSLLSTKNDNIEDIIAAAHSEALRRSFRQD